MRIYELVLAAVPNMLDIPNGNVQRSRKAVRHSTDMGKDVMLPKPNLEFHKNSATFCGKIRQKIPPLHIHQFTLFTVRKFVCSFIHYSHAYHLYDKCEIPAPKNQVSRLSCCSDHFVKAAKDLYFLLTDNQKQINTSFGQLSKLSTKPRRFCQPYSLKIRGKAGEGHNYLPSSGLNKKL